MYRGSHQSFAQTIERLEREVADLREAVSPRRQREGTLRLVTAASLCITLVALVACGAARARAEQLEVRVGAEAVRLERKTRDLGVCESMVDSSEHAAQQCRIEAWQGTRQAFSR